MVCHLQVSCAFAREPRQICEKFSTFYLWLMKVKANNTFPGDSIYFMLHHFISSFVDVFPPCKQIKMQAMCLTFCFTRSELRIRRKSVSGLLCCNCMSAVFFTFCTASEMTRSPDNKRATKIRLSVFSGTLPPQGATYVVTLRCSSVCLSVCGPPPIAC